jgi:23S rRNA 5-hydroxycytidine C2501 synthase
VLSLKDNDQSAHLAALVDAGIRSFKIEGRYKDMGYVKNITGHYRRLFDDLLEQRPALRPASDGHTRLLFTPDPQRNFNRESTDYFVPGRQDDIGAFDTPKHAGVPLGEVLRVGADHVEITLADGVDDLHNGDGLTYFDLQHELVGLQVNVATRLDVRRWRVTPNQPLEELRDLRAGTALARNRDMAWDRLLARRSAERRIAVDLRLDAHAGGLRLQVLDSAGHLGEAHLAQALEPARDGARALETLRTQLSRLGDTIFEARHVELALAQPVFLPAATINALRRETIAALEATRAAALPPLPRARPVEPPVPYPEDTLSYLANVYNSRARDFYARHGVRVIEAAYESHEALGEVSLMITKHCVRYSLSLCPKQAKGVTGVQGTLRAEPLTITHGDERLTLRFDCKPCEMHVVGRIKKNILQQAARDAREPREVPMQFYRTRPAPVRAG